ncbi:MAG TPA: hypothetical protein VN698_12985 [Bacteroidia bacterium]|nr:hypothetical protein [Bacteroidia bacterium]
MGYEIFLYAFWLMFFALIIGFSLGYEHKTKIDKREVDKKQTEQVKIIAAINNRDKILQAAVALHGCPKQIDMLHEEIGELMQSINKLKRLGGVMEREIMHANKDLHNGTKYSLAYFSLCGEVADVKIMLAQLENMLDKEAIALSENRKLARLADRIKLKIY